MIVCRTKDSIRKVVLVAEMRSQSRTVSEAASEQGVITAAAPLAADIGLTVLRAGGNVYDAVLAAAFAETVLLPPKCGLAGDLVALVVDSSEQAAEALVAIGPASRHLGRRVMDRGRLDPQGGISVGVPGAPAGYAALAARANLPITALVEPARELATRGFEWSPVAHRLTAEAVDLLADMNGAHCVYLPEGKPAASGEVVCLPGLAHTLEVYADNPGGFLEGPVGAAIVERVQGSGGVIDDADIASAVAEWCAPSTATIDGTRLWATPPPTYGRHLLRAVAEMRSANSRSAKREALERVILHRQHSLSDHPNSGTSVVAASYQGKLVVLVHSNSFQNYGSGIVVPGFDLVLSNRAGRGFSADPTHPNFPAAGKRPATTLHAWACALPTGEIFAGATPGGENQIRWNGQLLDELLSGCTAPRALVSNPRWGLHQGHYFDEADGAARSALTVRSGQQVVMVDAARSRHAAAADPRTGCSAVPVSIAGIGPKS